LPELPPYPRRHLGILKSILVLQLVMVLLGWFHAHSGNAVAKQMGRHPNVTPQAIRRDALVQWRTAYEPVLSIQPPDIMTMRPGLFFSDWALLANLLFLVVAFFCVERLKRDRQRQILQKQSMELVLSQERNALEKRIASRTAELQAEIAERSRAEQLNRGRSMLLEMLAREEPAHEIFRTLVDVIAKDRSRWCCVLHLVRMGELQIEASSGLPTKLMRSLQQTQLSMAETPEARALRMRQALVVEDISRERQPWTQLFYANGVQSLWTTPMFAGDGTPLGTLTIYSLLRCQPLQYDWEILDSHAHMASMVLERYRMQDELRRHAYHDSLTGLPNRLLGEEQLEAAINRAKRSRVNVAVLWMDLDKFKLTNDVQGHVAGDAVLKEVAARLSRRFRGSDLIARMGGDEFMAVLEGVPERATAETMAFQLIEDITEPIPFQGVTLGTSVSIGVSMYPDDGDTAELLERNADMAMYEAKFGRHGVRSYSPMMDKVLSERRAIERAMSRALEEGGFALHYQPQYQLDGRLSGFEALLRFPHPHLGMISPAQLIPIAEESQMIIALGDWVLQEACNQSRRWQAAGYSPIPIAVNISAAQFVQQDFAEQVAAVLGHTGLAPQLLELELTESVMVQDFAETRRQFQCLKQLGVRIAVDDFGTGYSSLNQLHRLPVDRLKIDRSFIESLGESSGSLPIVESIILMAHRMGMQVVAEGVETDEQMTTLRMQGCDSLQGYLLSRPVEADFAAKLLGEGSNSRLAQGAAPPLLLPNVHANMPLTADLPPTVEL
jgi:diguanylate cyclase (GGDEF)-like protein